jgi:hypothetical protein
MHTLWKSLAWICAAMIVGNVQATRTNVRTGERERGGARSSEHNPDSDGICRLGISPVLTATSPCVSLFFFLQERARCKTTTMSCEFMTTRSTSSAECPTIHRASSWRSLLENLLCTAQVQAIGRPCGGPFLKLICTSQWCYWASSWRSLFNSSNSALVGSNEPGP